VESLLLFAEELERRDADLGGALDAVERLQREVEELRVHALALAAFLSSFPEALDALERDERAALAARAAAESALRDAEGREDAYALVQAGDALGDAERWAADAVLVRGRLEDEGVARGDEAARLEAQVQALSPRVHDVPAPAGGPDGAVEWASRARGRLLLEHSGLARERDAVVREASELLGSVLGEPLTSTAVAGVRDKLERALQRGAP
jgi:FtsZ-binding cell division protein ZapB